MHSARNWCRALTLASLTLIALGINASALAEPTGDWVHLQDGGIVLFRHALAPGTGDPDNIDLSDCGTQRNLNEQGRSDAKRIGAVFRERNIPVGKVLTSQWCRCRETAALAFPDQAEDAPMFNSFFENRSQGPSQTAAAMKLLENWSGPGTLVVVTHQVNITALTGIFPQSGEGIIINIEDGELVVLGRLML